MFNFSFTPGIPQLPVNNSPGIRNLPVSYSPFSKDIGLISPSEFNMFSPHAVSNMTASTPAKPKYSVDAILSTSTSEPQHQKLPLTFRTSSPLPSVSVPSVGYLDRLRNNPMFSDLQATLAQECLHMQVPCSLLTNGCGSVEGTGETNLQILVNQRQLQDQFVTSRNRPGFTDVIHRLENRYGTEVSRIEMERHKALYSSMQNFAMKEALNIFYDQERLSLISRIQDQLTTACSSVLEDSGISKDSVLSSPSSDMSKRDNSDSALDLSSSIRNVSSPANDSGVYSSIHELPSPIVSSTFSFAPISPIPIHPYQPIQPHQHVVSTTSSKPSSPDSTSDSSVCKSSKLNRSLHPKATRFLQEWYDKHIQYPYPTEDKVAMLSDVTKLSDTQVKKWMANKRVRSYNTLSISGNDHPIKVRSRSRKRKSDSDDDIIPGAKRANYNQIGMDARHILVEWYDTHSDNPYPTEDEKTDLADQCCISVAQVKSWFANKRSRNCNTKKQTPNYFIKKFPQYYPLIQMVKERKEAQKQSVQTWSYM